MRAAKPNEPAKLAQYSDLITFLDKMAAGLGDLADALEKAFAPVTAEHPAPEPVFLGKAADIARHLQLSTMDWLERFKDVDLVVPIKAGVFCGAVAFLHLIGADSATAVATLGLLVRSVGSKTVPRKDGDEKKTTQGKKR